jgi:hypothetical protein
MDYYMQ